MSQVISQRLCIETQMTAMRQHSKAKGTRSKDEDPKFQELSPGCSAALKLLLAKLTSKTGSK